MTDDNGIGFELTAAEFTSVTGGFTLIQTLVQIDTIGFLTALVSPAVQPVRAAGK
jgi:type II secretory pathway pseudopilin PulG